MDLLKFAESAGGGGIISGAMGLIAGGIGARKQRKWQEKQNELNRDFAKEMAEQQNQYEIDRMGLQAKFNKEAADYSQQLAKDMWNYTGYENQKAQMEAAGLNPALMYGGGGGGGQSTNGGSQQGVAALQPMGLQVALQAEQARANIALTNAQTEKTKAEAIQAGTLQMASGAMDLISKAIQNKNTATDTLKKNAEIYNAEVNSMKTLAELGNVIQTGKLLFEQTRIACADANVAEKTVQSRIDTAAETYRNLVASTTKLFAEADTSGKQKELLQLEIDNFDDKLQAIIDGVINGRITAEAAMKQAETAAEIAGSTIIKNLSGANLQDVQKWKDIFDMGVDLLDIFLGGRMKAGKKLILKIGKAFKK